MEVRCCECVLALDVSLDRVFFYFFFNDTSTTEIYAYCHTLTLHDALPIWSGNSRRWKHRIPRATGRSSRLVASCRTVRWGRSNGLRCPRRSRARSARNGDADCRGSHPRTQCRQRSWVQGPPTRLEERRVGKESGSTCRNRGEPEL